MAKDAHKSTETDRLMLRVGARVRRAREMKNIPRRVLSDRSGVSPRYLAQLEAGEGNISIALLSRIATALDDGSASATLDALVKASQAA